MGLSRRRALGAGLGAVALAAVGCGRGRDRAEDDAGVEVLEYGPAARQRVELTVPEGSTGPVPVVVLIHGGFWSNAFDLDLMRPLVPSLVARGWAVANIDYRSVGDVGGGWPGTFDDAAAALDALAAALDALAARPDLDAEHVVAVGHSAGGHLAVWLAGRTDGAIRLAGAVAQAGVLDLVAAAEQRLGGGAVAALLGGEPADEPDVYADASPIARVPIGVPVVLVHGAGDGIVPLAQSTAYQAAATAAGDDVRLVDVAGDHFALIDPTSSAWAATLTEIDRLRSF